MAVAGSSKIQILHLQRRHKEETACKCRPMAFLEECSEHFPEFFYSVPRSWKCLNLNTSCMIQCLQMKKIFRISNGQRITYNCKEKRHCSLVLLHGCACYLQLLQCTENWLTIENYQTFSSTLLRLLEADTHLRTPLRIPFQNWGWTRKRVLATQMRWSATNTAVENGLLQTRYCLWRYKHVRGKGPSDTEKTNFPHEFRLHQRFI